METDKNYFLVGLFVIVLMLGVLGFSLWLTAAGKGDYLYYRIRFNDSVSGLNEQSGVKFRGVTVGHVDHISIDPDNAEQVRVDVSILKGTPIRADSIATLEIKGITGDLYVELTAGTKSAPLVRGSHDEDHPAEIRSGPNNINLLMDRLTQLSEKMNHIADQVGKVFSDENVKDVNHFIHRWFGSGDDKDEKKEKGAVTSVHGVQR